MTTIVVAYTFLCLGFCLGFVVCSIFRVAQPMETASPNGLTATPLREGRQLGNTHQRRKWDGPVPPPPPPARAHTCTCPRTVNFTGVRIRTHRDPCGITSTDNSQ